MKQLLFGLSIIAGTMAASAQLKKDTTSLINKAILLAPRKTLAVATQADANIIPLTPTILQGANSIATGSVKARDLGIPFIHCGMLTDAGCGKSTCGLDASHIEFMQDDGSPMMLNKLPSKVFKPGQYFSAQNTNPLWGVQASYCGTQMVFKMVLDPPNMTGDQDLGNNILTFSVAAQY